MFLVGKSYPPSVLTADIFRKLAPLGLVIEVQQYLPCKLYYSNGTYMYECGAFLEPLIGAWNIFNPSDTHTSFLVLKAPTLKLLHPKPST